MANNSNRTKVITGTGTRLSYFHGWEPVSINGGAEKYSVSVLIPKSDTETVNAINAAIDAAIEEGVSKFGGKKPNRAAIKLPLRDGDTERDDEAYKGAYFVNATSTTAPQIVDTAVQPILDRGEVYSGCYARVSVNFYAFNSNGNRGIACGLGNIQKQTANPKMVFSYENDTLDSSSLESARNNTNFLIVAGQGEGADRAVVSVGTGEGFRRVEGFIDARDVSDDALLPERGAAKLAEYGDSVTFSARASQLVADKYGVDFDLGDLCTVIDTYGGLRFEVDARITEITECYEDGAVRLDISFGYDKTGLADVINRKIQNTQALIKKE